MVMWEFTLINKNTQEMKIVFGTTYSRAIEKLENPEDWICVSSDFVD